LPLRISLIHPVPNPAPEACELTGGFFIAIAARPAGLCDPDIATLSPFLRALLTIDGTVTQFIEAYTLERVTIEVMEQAPGSAGDAGEWLDCPAGEPALHRHSLLWGEGSGVLYAWAESVLLPGRLTADIRSALDSESGGLGRIMLNSQLETRREGLWYGRESREILPAALGAAVAGEFLTRSYRVIANRQPIMLITERFPLTLAC
jgi:chorismate-pyruvate lyase